MTIEKGAAWGVHGTAPHDLVVAADEAALARAVESGVRHAALRAGDVLRALGLTDATPPLAGEPALLLPCDAMRVRLDDRAPLTAVSTIIVGRRFRERIVASAGGFVGVLNVAPRAHPNDGLLDVLVVAPRTAARQLLAVRRRMRLGDHLPHPALTMRRAAAHEFSFADAPQRVTIDGRRHGRARRVRIDVLPDAFVLCIARR
jgi:hypothetical protein